MSPLSEVDAAAGRRAQTEPVGDLAIVLHSHMPYVEGYGTYPFGEEWLFDAIIRSYLPLLDALDGVTMTVTPVLADQLEHPEVIDRARRFLVESRIGWAEADAHDADEELREPARHAAERHRRALERLDGEPGGLLEALGRRQEQGRVQLMASAATHAVLPLLATRAGVRLQLDVGARSHRRRFGPATGLWLPECAYAPGIERLVAEAGYTHFCVDQSAHEDPLDALAPVRTVAGPTALTIDWETVSRVWSWEGYPSDPAYNEFHRTSWRGTRLWSSGGEPYDPEAAARRVQAHASEFLDAVARKLARYRAERGVDGLVVCALDTELLGHWWTEGPQWLEAVLAGAPERGIETVTLEQALARHEPVDRPLAPSTWGEDKNFETWDSPAVGDLVAGVRRLELRVTHALATGRLEGEAAERAVRELLAVQASDWAFLDNRGKAGDYPWHRVLGHSEALLDALESRGPAASRVRNLAPDLRLAPLLTP
ncbi:MAG: 1,4-alpha-glucan branching protein domain-containing protein [Solirubrobacterales bacterium]